MWCCVIKYNWFAMHGMHWDILHTPSSILYAQPQHGNSMDIIVCKKLFTFVARHAWQHWHRDWWLSPASKAERLQQMLRTMTLQSDKLQEVVDDKLWMTMFVSRRPSMLLESLAMQWEDTFVQFHNTHNRNTMSFTYYLTATTTLHTPSIMAMAWQ